MLGRAQLAAILVTGASVGLTIAPCIADDSAWGGSLVATTDYVFRGLSQTQGGAALQGDLHYRGSAGWFAGIWASNIDQTSDYIGNLELDLYVGWAWNLPSNWSARLSYVRYLYPDTSPGWDYDYGDVTAGLSYRDRVFLAVAWSPDMVRFTDYGYERRGRSLSYELSLRQPVWRGLTLAGGAGYQDVSDLVGSGYWSWSATLLYPIGAFELDLSRFGNDGTARRLFGADTANDRWALTAIWRF